MRFVRMFHHGRDWGGSATAPCAATRHPLLTKGIRFNPPMTGSQLSSHLLPRLLLAHAAPLARFAEHRAPFLVCISLVCQSQVHRASSATTFTRQECCCCCLFLTHIHTHLSWRRHCRLVKTLALFKLSPFG